MSGSNVRLVTWDPGYARDFDRLNRWWLEKYFTVEPLDEFYLSNPQGTVIDKGGEIFFALDGDVPVGCCAAVPHVNGTLELAKLGVMPEAHGRGVGRMLCESVIAWALAHGYATVFLTSNSTLLSAIGLYERLGFAHAVMPFPRPYVEADIYMELPLTR